MPTSRPWDVSAEAALEHAEVRERLGANMREVEKMVDGYVLTHSLTYSLTVSLSHPFRHGLVARIRRSHRRGRGAIPRGGTSFFLALALSLSFGSLTLSLPPCDYLSVNGCPHVLFFLPLPPTRGISLPRVRWSTPKCARG